MNIIENKIRHPMHLRHPVELAKKTLAFYKVQAKT